MTPQPARPLREAAEFNHSFEATMLTCLLGNVLFPLAAWTFMFTGVGLFAAGEDTGTNRAVFTIEVDVGNYLFIGLDTGTVGKHPVELGIRPAELFRVPDLMTGGRTRVVVTRPLSIPAGTTNAVRLLYEVRHQETKEAAWATLYEGWMDAPLVNRNDWPPPSVSDPAPRQREPGQVLGRVKVDRIPYAKVEDEVYALVIAQGASPADLRAVIRVPKTFILFRWENASTVKW